MRIAIIALGSRGNDGRRDVHNASTDSWGRHGLSEACQNWQLAGNPTREALA